MKIFLLGDFDSNTGPANANRQVFEVLKNEYEVVFSNAPGKFARVMEALREIRKNDILVICSSSKLNYIAIRFAKWKHKKMIYLMHGYVSLERKIEHPDISAKEGKAPLNYEDFVFSRVDRIVCVSKNCENYMINALPEYSNKFDYVYNTVDINRIIKVCESNKDNRKKNAILSAGGGMKRKNNLTIAKVIDKYFDNVEYCVVGAELSEGEQIKKCKNVNYHEHLSQDELFKVMSASSLYIQNSTFDTFCLAVIEALYAGCSILISKNIGCLDLFGNISDDDIIYDVNSETEIYEKVTKLLKEPNNKRLHEGFKKEFISIDWQKKRWKEIIDDIIDENKGYEK